MVQQAITDGGIVSQPAHYYQENREIYEYIRARLSGTKESYLSADRDDRLRLLFDSATYALLTANAPLEQADRAFRVYRDHYPDLEPNSLGSDFADNGIGFYNTKSQYIVDNYSRLSSLFSDVDDMLVSGDNGDAQERLMDASGLGPAKSAFSLAMLGWTDYVCLDTHVCQYLDIDPREYDKHNADQYQELVNRAFQKIPDLQDEVSPFLLQWLVFDINRGKIETHDLWFEHVARVV